MAHQLEPARQRKRAAVLEPEVGEIFARAHDGVADGAAVAKAARDAGIDHRVVPLRGERARRSERRFHRTDADGDDVDAVTRGQRGQLLGYRADDEDADVGTRWLATQSGPTSR